MTFSAFDAAAAATSSPLFLVVQFALHFVRMSALPSSIPHRIASRLWINRAAEQTWNLWTTGVAYSHIFFFPVCASFHFQASFCLHFYCARRPKLTWEWKDPHTEKKETSEYDTPTVQIFHICCWTQTHVHFWLLKRPSSQHQLGCHEQWSALEKFGCQATSLLSYNDWVT